MILERGEEGTREWLEAIAGNEPVDFEGNLPIVEATDSGELEGGLVNHYYLLQLRAQGVGRNAENYFIPAGDAGSLVMPAGVGVLAASDQATSAEQLVEFLLSDEAQTYFATDTFEYPLIDGIAGPAGSPPLSEIDAPDIDVSDLSGVLDDATRLVAEAGLV
jgi:iron(III) transport system substrate-binding protein